MPSPIITPVSPGDPITAATTNEIIERLIAQHSGHAVLVDSTGVYTRPMHAEGGIELKHFELKTPLEQADSPSTGPQSAEAYVLQWDEANSQYTLPTDDEDAISATVIDVWATLGMCRGRCRDQYDAPYDVGSTGIAVLAPESGRWEIVRMRPSATLIRGTMTGVAAAGDGDDLEVGDPHCYITVATMPTGAEYHSAVLQPIGGLITDQDPAEEMQVFNSLDWNADDGATVRARWDEPNERWELDWIDCPAE